MTGVDAGLQGMLFRLSMTWRSHTHRRPRSRQPFADSRATAHLWLTCHTFDPTQIHPRPKYIHTHTHTNILNNQRLLLGFRPHPCTQVQIPKARGRRKGDKTMMRPFGHLFTSLLMLIINFLHAVKNDKL